jgi:ABC-2 type transport system ATP-binding protein
MSEAAIRIEGLVKHYGKTRAVDGLSLAVPRGSIYGFLGRNGAGKTTTIKTLLGLARATSGSASVLGYDIGREHLQVLQHTGFVSENKALFDNLTGEEIVRFNRGFFPTWSDKHVERYRKLFEIPMDVPFGKLSLGNKTKVCLLLAMSQGADLLMLDEPTAGLDPVAIDQLMEVLIDDHASEGRTVFLSSHQLAHVQKIVEWVGIIAHGRLLLEARLEDIRQDYRVITAAGADTAARLERPEIVAMRHSQKFWRYLVSQNAEAVASDLRQRGMAVSDVSPCGLEDVFLGVVRKEEHAGVEVVA